MDIQNRPQFQLIRNATFKLKYNGINYLFDPMFAAKGELKSITGKANSPLVDLPISVEEILTNTDVVVVTHSHFDHFDELASESMDKKIELIHQPADTLFFKEKGFTNSTSFDDSIDYKSTTIIRTHAQHGSGRVLDMMGQVSGFILKAQNLPTVYVVGDAIWTNDIYKNIEKHQPDYIIINTGGAFIPGYESTPIIMDEFQTMTLIQEAAEAKVIAIHMDALDHCRTTREVLKATAEEHKISPTKLLIPTDGQSITL